MNQSQALEQLERYIRARYPIVVLISHEESRVMAGVKAVAERRERQVAVWSITQGLRSESLTERNGKHEWQQNNDFDPDSTRDPIAAFDAMINFQGDRPYLFVMKDLHGILDQGQGRFDPLLTRHLRDLAARFEEEKHNLILVSPAFPIPADLEKTISVIDWPLPDEQELAAILTNCEASLPKKFPVHLNGDREQVVQSLRGLTAFEASSVLLSGVVAQGELSNSIVGHIVKEKAQIIRKSGVLEFYDSTVTMAEVGGLENLKAYAAEIRLAFSQEAAEFGLDTPKGVLLAGIPGTGKSLAAKAIAGGQMPLLRMDVGALMGGFVGDSEANMRAALKVAEAVSPAVLWIDECEKALGASGGETDGGTTSRVFGTILTWMQECKSPVYVVATANDVGKLKEEFIRRFDDLFWVDLPTRSSRIEILTVHLRKRSQDPALVDLEAVADALWGFSGAEIEKVVKEALRKSFFLKAPVTTDALIYAAGQIIPLSASMKTRLEDLRNRVQNARWAAEPLEPKPVAAGSGRLLDE